MSQRHDNHLWFQLLVDRENHEFHQSNGNNLLIRYWPNLGLAPGSKILVPLCGKRLDMLWLAEQGFEVIGVELNQNAVQTFFKENRLPATKTQVGLFHCWQYKNIRIFCGDIFSLNPEDIGEIHAIYDPVALTALSREIRLQYVSHMQTLAGTNADIFLLSIEEKYDSYPIPLMQRPQVDEELLELYQQAFAITQVRTDQLFEAQTSKTQASPGLLEYKIYHLSKLALDE